ncbi:beta-N-acetylhexosaminidase [Alistipes sp.]|uniref:beta-N-acetylhexosaminidase n=1 Tax=Alistipes sp. TaxID=1872444 RepID=UPI003AF1A49E
MKKILLILASGVALAACGDSARPVAIVPYPNSIQTRSGVFDVRGRTVACDSRADERTQRAASEFARQVAAASSAENPFVVTDELPARGIRFELCDTLPEEAYRLDITRRAVTVRASAFPGFFHAVQTLKQLLPAAVFGGESDPGAEWTLPCLEIADAPRFAYRGMHLDVSRHFFGVEEVKRYIDLLALHKLNRLHWHLTDDQGWRIEIRRYPELTEIGSIRPKTMIRKEWDNYDTTPYGGYYTQDQIREVVAYAADRAIEVIPEIDLPGHMLAALAAYPQLGCTGGPYTVWGQWGVADDVLCAGREETFEFIEGVLAEVIELFPSPLIHIGGDECPKVRWERCPRCQARIRQLGLKDDVQHTAEHYLQSYVMARVGEFLARNGRRIIGWDEILEGEAPADATIMSWRGDEGGVAAARQGHEVVMTPTSHFYFDYYQSLDTENEPFGIGGYVPVEQVYSYEPPFGELTPEERQRIVGVQANLWTEYIASNEHLEYMLLPRLAALSEVQWCRPGVRDWQRFAANFPLAPIYRAMGCNFARHLFGVTGACEVDTDEHCLRMTLSTQGDAPIRYTTDGSDPALAGTPYTGPVRIAKSCRFRAAALRDDVEGPQYEREFAFSKSTARHAVLNTSPTPKYTYGGASLLVDGYCGVPVYANGAWVGFMREPLDATIDMQGAGPYEAVELETLVQRGEWIFPPARIEVLTSDDGTEFVAAGSLDVAEEPAEAENGIRRYTVRFPATEAPFLRVVARTVARMPAWHPAAGLPGHLFVGEIAVN